MSDASEKRDELSELLGLLKKHQLEIAQMTARHNPAMTGSVYDVVAAVTEARDAVPIDDDVMKPFKREG